MPKDGEVTRTKLLDAAQELILQSGFAGTSVDRVIEKAGVTKGTFFYHFDSKAELARALIDRFSATDVELLEEALRRAEALSKDPIRQVLAVVDFFEEKFEKLDHLYPGCLFASYVYEAQLFDPPTLEIVARFAHLWRRRLAPKLREAIKLHPPKKNVDPDELADGLTVVFEGSMILSKLVKDPKAIAAHLRHYRRYLELLFEK
jgi:TetR/AcrR family transcriptional regulator, transcriptional repressor for nem operon